MNPNESKAKQQSILFTTTPELRETHPCFNCPLIKNYGGVLFCYRPSCPYMGNNLKHYINYKRHLAQRR